MNVFPFTLYCDREHGGVPYGFYQSWMSVKPEKLIWYGVDVTLQSPTHIDFTVYDMEDWVHGGCGRVIHRCSGIVDASVTRKAIEARAHSLTEAILANLDKDTPCP